MHPDRIFLVGLSGSGKSTAGRLFAESLGWDFVDTDRQIEQAAGRPIPEIFESDGEEAFRELEAAALDECLGRREIVVATGGGALTTEPGRRAIAGGFSVWLSISPTAAAARLAGDASTEARPLLRGDLESRLTALHTARVSVYQSADAAIDVESMTPDQVVTELLHLLQEHRGGANQSRPGVAEYYRPEGDIAAWVRTPTAEYPVVVAHGGIESLGDICRDRGLKGRAHIIADATVLSLYGDRVTTALESAGYASHVLTLAGGEPEKHLGTVSRVYDWLITNRAERGDFVVCLGGGVITDLAGFAASTYLRGIAFVHVPTTLLGMVDAAIGGKTGVDHPMGKNLVGAFAQPSAVVIDPTVLTTLPLRELRAGWAEVVKHGLILDRTLFDELASVAGDPSAMADARLIGWSTAIKAAVVSEDERESDRRTLLNYGHTLGHAIEAVTGYSEYLHGEAVAIGMRAAGMMSVEMGLLSVADFDRQQEVLRRCGLPESAPGVSVEAILDATLRDKKVSGGRVRWVLLERLGSATINASVPPELVREAAETVLA